MSWSARTSQWLGMANSLETDQTGIYARFSMQYMAFNAFYTFFGDQYDKKSSIGWMDKAQFTITEAELKNLFQTSYVEYFLERMPKDDEGQTHDAPILDLRHRIDPVKFPIVPTIQGKPEHYLIRHNLGDENLGKKHLKQLIGVVYQVRCNLIHGGKLPCNGSNVEVVRIASDVLIHVMGIALPQFE